MTEFTILLSDADTDRLYALKALEGRADMTGNEYATELLTLKLRQMHPERPQ